MPKSKLIVNLTRGSVVCEQARIADGPLTRMRGLMGRRAIASTDGMLLRPAPAIHTAFMRFAIDALFLDADLRVLKAVDGLRPWRASSRRDARAVLELAGGERVRRGVEVGDRLAVLDGPAEIVAWTASAVIAQTPEITNSHGHPGSASPARALTLTDCRPPATARVAREGDDPIRVLLLAPDRRFRDTTALLLSRRGCEVSVAGSVEQAVELAADEGPHVVVLDAGRSLTAAARSVAALEALRPPVGVVVVADDGESGLAQLPVLDRWGSFDALYEAVEQADRGRSQRRSLVERD